VYRIEDSAPKIQPTEDRIWRIDRRSKCVHAWYFCYNSWGDFPMRLAAIRCFSFRVSLLLLLEMVALPGHFGRAQSTAATPAAVDVEIDANAEARPFPHFWEKMFGSGRAILSLRDSYRNDLRETKRITGVEYVRFHAIFHDEVGVYDEDASGKPTYNFSYVDQIYDGLVENKVRPFVELSFMPKKLTSDPNALHAF